MPTYKQDTKATTGNAPINYGSPCKQVGMVDPLMTPQNPQSLGVPPPQANTMGNARPVFDPLATQFGAGIYGNDQQRAQSMPQGLGAPNPSPLSQEERFKAPPPETTGGKGLRKMSEAELMRRDISYQNDSLRKLPKTDLNYLPTFNTNTDEGSDAQEVYYSNKKNLKRLKELDRPIRQQYGY